MYTPPLSPPVCQASRRRWRPTATISPGDTEAARPCPDRATGESRIHLYLARSSPTHPRDVPIPCKKELGRSSLADPLSFGRPGLGIFTG